MLYPPLSVLPSFSPVDPSYSPPDKVLHSLPLVHWTWWQRISWFCTPSTYPTLVNDLLFYGTIWWIFHPQRPLGFAKLTSIRQIRMNLRFWQLHIQGTVDEIRRATDSPISQVLTFTRFWDYIVPHCVTLCVMSYYIPMFRTWSPPRRAGRWHLPRVGHKEAKRKHNILANGQWSGWPVKFQEQGGRAPKLSWTTHFELWGPNFIHQAYSTKFLVRYTFIGQITLRIHLNFGRTQNRLI